MQPPNFARNKNQNISHRFERDPYYWKENIQVLFQYCWNINFLSRACCSHDDTTECLMALQKIIFFIGVPNITTLQETIQVRNQIDFIMVIKRYRNTITATQIYPSTRFAENKQEKYLKHLKDYYKIEKNTSKRN